eukprot:CAMPEP_0172691728 /NCGR_PEP_ID=MMETSP1074-20121228/24759_1 /TAXON_ID=2916 /ORGANISM="Ceratium fusus, Strain PA161109" /LENGTH=47 /DNA_ID= /DNA_START= /DNA_END= /DNA_ORIENTATION=
MAAVTIAVTPSTPATMVAVFPWRFATVAPVVLLVPATPVVVPGRGPP